MLVKIKRFGINGEGIAYKNKKAIFVEGALPDELVDVLITEKRPTYDTAKILKVIEPSPRRRHPICPVADQCGGCRMIHVDYKGQVRMKEAALREALLRYASYRGPIEPLMKNPEPLSYRNSSKTPFGMKDGKIVSGMYSANSHDFIPVERCLIHTKKQESIRQEIVKLMQKHNLKAWSDEKPEGYKTLVLREFDGQVHVILVTSDLQVPDELIREITAIDGVASLWQSKKRPDDPEYELFTDRVVNLAGAMKMNVSINDLNLCLLPKSFFQLNTAQAANLYAKVMELIPAHCHLLVEAYCGIGTMALMAADHADEVIGIEYVDDAIDNAKDNALVNGRDNVKFVCGDAARELNRISDDQKVDVLIVDPPRSGLKEDMVKAILKAAPETVIYVSCNPSTLGKDLALMKDEYEINYVQPVDMFSQTPLVESIVRLKKRNTPIQSDAKKQKTDRKHSEKKTFRSRKPGFKPFKRSRD